MTYKICAHCKQNNKKNICSLWTKMKYVLCVDTNSVSCWPTSAGSAICSWLDFVIMMMTMAMRIKMIMTMRMMMMILIQITFSQNLCISIPNHIIVQHQINFSLTVCSENLQFYHNLYHHNYYHFLSQGHGFSKMDVFLEKVQKAVNPSPAPPPSLVLEIFIALFCKKS